MRSQISELVDEVYAEHEGRVHPKPRLRSVQPVVCPPLARANWEAVSRDYAQAMSTDISDTERAAIVAIRAEERRQARLSSQFHTRVNSQVPTSSGLGARILQALGR